MSLNTNAPAAAFVAGEIVTAAKMNEIRTAFTGLQAGWDTYTPTLGATTTNPNVTYTRRVGRYLRTGKTVVGLVTIELATVTSAGSGTLSINMPVTPGQGGQFTAIGSGFIRYDSSTSATVAGRWNSSSDQMGMTRTVSGASSDVTTAAPATLIAGTIISVLFEYELP